MKKFIQIIALFIMITQAIKAQDIITLNNGKEISSKIIDVNSTEIHFKIFNDLNGPTQTILKTNVFKIKYENGKTEVIKIDETSTTKGKSEVNSNEQSKKNILYFGLGVFPQHDLSLNIGDQYYIVKHFSIGVYALYATFNETLSGSGSSYYDNTKRQTFAGGIRGEYHIVSKKKVDLFGAVALGYKSVKTTNESNYYYNYKSEDKENSFSPGAYLGIRLGSKASFCFEIGAGTNLVLFGLGFRF